MTETEISLERKLKILADAAKYDVACTSEWVKRRGKKGILGIRYLRNECSGDCNERTQILQWMYIILFRMIVMMINQFILRVL